MIVFTAIYLIYKVYRTVIALKRIRVLRRENDEKQIDLARYLDVPQAMLSNWERGVHFPPKDIIFKIADRYGVSVDYLMGYSENREFSDVEPIRILHEYLSARTGLEFERTEVLQLDRIIQDVISYSRM